jgi:hypothetical protein
MLTGSLEACWVLDQECYNYLANLREITDAQRIRRAHSVVA